MLAVGRFHKPRQPLQLQRTTEIATVLAAATESRLAVLVDCDSSAPEVLQHAPRVDAQFSRIVLRRVKGIT